MNAEEKISTQPPCWDTVLWTSPCTIIVLPEYETATPSHNTSFSNGDNKLSADLRLRVYLVHHREAPDTRMRDDVKPHTGPFRRLCPRTPSTHIARSSSHCKPTKHTKSQRLRSPRLWTTNRNLGSAFKIVPTILAFSQFRNFVIKDVTSCSTSDAKVHCAVRVRTSAMRKAFRHRTGRPLERGRTLSVTSVTYQVFDESQHTTTFVSGQDSLTKDVSATLSKPRLAKKYCLQLPTCAACFWISAIILAHRGTAIDAIRCHSCANMF